MQVTRPTVAEVAPLVRALYEKHPAGGPLHIVLEDCNVENSSVQFCLERAEAAGDEEAVHLARLLLQMTRSQRARLALHR